MLFSYACFTALCLNQDDIVEVSLTGLRGDVGGAAGGQEAEATSEVAMRPMTVPPVFVGPRGVLLPTKSSCSFCRHVCNPPLVSAERHRTPA